MASSWLFALSWCFLGPFLCILFSDVLFSRAWIRASCCVTTLYAVWFLVLRAQFENALVAYLVGFLAPWIAIRTFTIFWKSDAPAKLATMRLNQADLSGNPKLEWHGFPAAPSISKSFMVVDFLLDFRSVGWCPNFAGGLPCKLHRRMAADRQNDIRKERPSAHMIMVQSAFRVFSSLLWIEICQAFLLPMLRGEPADVSSESLWRRVLSHSGFRIGKIITIVSMSSALSDLVFMGTNFCYSILYLVGFRNLLISLIHPSPWGDPSLPSDKGIVGVWMNMWNYHFQLGLRNTAQSLSQPILVDLSPQAAETLKTTILFLLSGILHMCAALACTKQERNSLGGLAFFLLQPVAIAIQEPINARRPETVSRRNKITNIAFCVIWFFITYPMLADEQIRCGIWEVRLSRMLHYFQNNLNQER